MAFTTRTHENSTKLLTTEFTKKIAVLKKYRKFEIMAFKSRAKIFKFLKQSNSSILFMRPNSKSDALEF
ncbi:hypothetical protein AR546_21230 [Leptospira interrogans serovar Canicola]|nr:hypothetical protein B2G47_04915 [Leptospira interrogans serovar Canicola]OMH63148.1 hypothetical protein BW243_13875 [Leptospira interrogans serovar Pomona]TQE59858.1 hypothetical protein FF006_04995 [Leptospira interrogans]ASV08912.1 hypothetical protein B2G50_08710 [Leptospira interrogans serovar Canicola]MCR8626550.1 hypothetical protein [Leptospira interrogans serovar Canicola]